MRVAEMILKPKIQEEKVILNYGAKPKLQPKVPKYPIVLCHGFSGFDGLMYIPTIASLPKFILPDWMEQIKKGNPHGQAIKKVMDEDNTESLTSSIIPENGKFLVEYWNGIKTHLEAYHCQVLVAKVPPFASIDTRAKALHNYIKSQIPDLRQHYSLPLDQKVKLNLIAHSMGGLDARFLISQYNDELNEHYQIVSLTTLSTPHHGTTAADFALSLVPEIFIQKFFPSVFQLTPEYSKTFNKFVLDDPKVKYFSYGAAFTPNPSSMFFLTWHYVNDREGPNDGLISLKSAHWGKWMGYVPGIDHADMINWVGVGKHFQTLLGINEYPFQAKWMYSDIINNLALNGL